MGETILSTSRMNRILAETETTLTVESGLSVAAITYYVVGLFVYLAKGAHDSGAPIEPNFATAIFVPLAALVIWYVVRRVRKRHIADE